MNNNNDNNNVADLQSDFKCFDSLLMQWHPLGHMQVCTLLQTDNHASTPPLVFFTGRMPFLPPNQQRQSTEGIMCKLDHCLQWNTRA